MSPRIPRGALLDGPNLYALEVALARLEDRVRTVEMAVRSASLDARDLRDLRRQVADVKRETADAALLGSALRKIGRHLTQGGSPRLR